MEQLHIISLTHKNAPLDLIGKLHVDETRRKDFLLALKEKVEVSELAYLSTCNRVTFIMNSPSYFCKGRQHRLLEQFELSGPEKARILEAFATYRGEDAMRHLLEVSASLDSMVLGEREIITQVRKSFEDARSYGTGGDLLRLTARKVIETAKRIFTETAIATRPVSVVSLSWKWFLARRHPKDTPILLIGAGQTNANFARFLVKSGYRNVTVANRTLERAASVAQASGWQAVQLYHIPEDRSYRVVVACTGSELPIVTNDFLKGITGEAIDLIDMAVPADVAADVIARPDVTYLGMPQLQQQAAENIEVRKQEIDRCRLILDESLEEFRAMVRQREVELAMREIPDAIRAIREAAMGEVFAKELDQMDAASRALLEKIVGYMEKKYISVPMKLARKVILENARVN